MKLLVGIQARTNSTRLPGKIYKNIGPKPVLKWVYDAAKEAERQIRATKTEVETAIIGFSEDEALKDFCNTHLLKSYFPLFASENDLITRYLNVMRSGEFTHLIRLTADCWSANPFLICTAHDVLKNEIDYVSNTIHRSFPEGLDIQGCSFEALKWFDKHQETEREHPFAPFEANKTIRDAFSKKLKIDEIWDRANPIFVKLSIDTKEDLERANQLYEQAQKHKSDMDRESQERLSTGTSRN